MTADGSTSEPLWTKTFTLTVLATFLIFIPYALFLPVLPIYTLEKLHGSPAEAGAVNAVFLIAMVFFRSQTDRIEQMLGTRNVLFISALLFACSNFIYLMAGTTTMLMIIRFFGGVFFSLASTCLLVLGSLFTPLARKAEGLAYLATAVTVGTAIGPFSGLLLAKVYGFMWVFLLSGLLALLGAFTSLWIAIPEKNLIDQNKARGFALRTIFEARAIPASIIALLLMFAISAVLTFVSVYANLLHLSVVSTYFFVVLALCAIGSRLVTGHIYDRFGANYVIYPAIVSLALGLLILGSTDNTLGMFSAAALVGFAYGIAAPGIQALALHKSPPHRMAVATATFYTFFDLGMGAGAYLLGVCIPYLGYANIYLVLSPFILSVGLLYYVLMHGNKRNIPVCSEVVDLPRNEKEHAEHAEHG